MSHQSKMDLMKEDGMSTPKTDLVFEPGLILGIAHFGFRPTGENPAAFAIWLGQICGDLPVTGNSSRMVGRSGEGQIEILLQPDVPHVAIRVLDMERAKAHLAQQWEIEFEHPKVNTDDHKVVYFKGFYGGIKFHLVWDKLYSPS